MKKPSLRFFGAALLIASCASMAAAGRPAAAAPFQMSDQQEIEAGHSVAAQAVKDYGGVLPPDDAMSRRVGAVGSQIAALATRRGIPYSFAVLKDDTAFNAFAAPGGPVLVTKKLVAFAANDAELAYLLAHETAHIDARQVARQIESDRNSSDSGTAGAKWDPVAAAGDFTFTVWDRGYSAEDLTQADTLGLRLMSQAGYDPQGAVSVLRKLAAGQGYDEYLATHPDPASRLQAVQRQIESEHLADVAHQHGGPLLWYPSSSGPAAGSALPAPAPQTEPNGQPVPNSPPVPNAPPVPDGQPAPGAQPGPAMAPQAAPGPAEYGVTEAPGPDSPPAYRPSSNEHEIMLQEPILLVDANHSRVIMAPVAELARWAHALVQPRGNWIYIFRGYASMRLHTGSARIGVRGFDSPMSAPANIYNGVMYAPIGSVVQGMGGNARLDAQNGMVHISLPPGINGFVRLP